MPGAGHGGSAADALGPVWRRQVADVRFWESELRSGRPDGVHGFRVSTRRLRSCLTGFEPLLERSTCRRLSDDLRGTAGRIGEARDGEAVRDRIAHMFGAGADTAEAAVCDRLVPRLEELLAEGRRRSLDHLDSAAYDDLTRRLEGFADLPPWRTSAMGPARQVLRPLLASEWSRFRRRGRAALEPDAPDATLHTARKAAKRARYVSEALVPVFGRRAQRLEVAAEGVQGVLGDFQDTALTRAFLADAARRATPCAEERAVLDRMQALQAQAAAAQRTEFARRFREADRKSLRAWLR